MHVSADGYVRVDMAVFCSISLVHLLSALDADADLPLTHASGACVASITGYTEWVSPGWPALSLGWDWSVATGEGRVRYQRDGEVRSNVMLVNARWRDLGAQASAMLLCAAIDSLEWESTVEHFIRDRYGSDGSSPGPVAW